MKQIRYIIISLLIVLSISFVSASTLSDGLVSYWNMDSNSSNILVDSKGFDNGTINNSVKLVAGKIGNALYFNNNANNFVYFHNNNFDFGSKSFSIAFWVNATSTSDMYFFSKDNRAYNASDDSAFILQTGFSNKIFIQRIVDGGGSNFVSSTALNTNNWDYFIVTYDNITHRMIYYQNNNIVLNDTTTKYDLSNNAPLYMGRSGPAQGVSPAIAVMDEVAIYNRSISTAEANLLWNEGAGRTYPFDEATFSIAGVCSYNSTPINNATVSLINPTTNAIYGTTSTNSSGNYLFSSSTYLLITNQSEWVVSAYYKNSTSYYAKSIWVNATVAD